jgi:hypothetical protein
VKLAALRNQKPAVLVVARLVVGLVMILAVKREQLSRRAVNA